MELNGWIETCAVEDIDQEDVMRFDHGDRTFAVYRTDKNEFFASDGFCTHQKIHLAEGLVTGHVIECPKHNGRFDVKTGEPKRAPVCVKLITYPVKVEAGKVYIKID
jgi:3-phenylpropionate/trans-cinnamate dioxygenase ferredoxin component